MWPDKGGNGAKLNSDQSDKSGKGAKTINNPENKSVIGTISKIVNANKSGNCANKELD
jgi:hypothetical protein